MVNYFILIFLCHYMTSRFHEHLEVLTNNNKLHGNHHNRFHLLHPHDKSTALHYKAPPGNHQDHVSSYATIMPMPAL